MNLKTWRMAWRVLRLPHMKSAILAASACLVFSTTAWAGGYLGLALGTQPGINDAMQSEARPLGRSLRGIVGARFGNVSIEGAGNGFNVLTQNHGEQTVYQVSGALKLSLPLGNNFEGFGRVGLERTWLSEGVDRYDLTGNGFVIGAGFEYRLDAVLSRAALFVDYNVHHATLEDTRHKVDETTRIWSLGFTVGI